MGREPWDRIPIATFNAILCKQLADEVGFSLNPSGEVSPDSRL